ncbi:MAG: amidohydrolase family protein [Pseudomonadota bacterium]
MGCGLGTGRARAGADLYGGRHAFLRDCDLAFDGDRISFVGKAYDGAVDEVIDARGKMLLPGFVNIHSHPNSEPLLKGLSEERKSRQLNMSSLYEYIFLLGRPAHDLAVDPDTAHFGTADFAAYSAACQVAIAEMLRSGVTCFVDYSANRRTGSTKSRAPVSAPWSRRPFRSGEWYTPNGHEVLYRWNEPRGRQGLDGAVALIMQAQKHPSGLLSGMMAPAQVDTCTADLMVDASAAARDLGVPCQTPSRAVGRRGARDVPPPRQDAGRLAGRSRRARAAFHPRPRHLPRSSFLDPGPDHIDLDLIADSGTSVAHCPNQFARGGMVLEHFGKYVKRGVNMGLGTDTFPHNFIDEMRWAIVVAKIASADIGSTSLAEVFTAATVGGAKALGRDDIGRCIRAARPTSRWSIWRIRRCSRCAIRSRAWCFTALERPITDVYVAGQPVVRDGMVLTIDLAANLAELSAGQARNMQGISERRLGQAVPPRRRFRCRSVGPAATDDRFGRTARAAGRGAVHRRGSLHQRRRAAGAPDA